MVEKTFSLRCQKVGGYLLLISLLELLVFTLFNVFKLPEISETLTNNEHVEYQYMDKNIFNHYILFLRATSNKRQIFHDDFYRTFKFFWPFNSIPANLLIILDEENESDHQFALELHQIFKSDLKNEIANKSFNYWITFDEPGNDTIYNQKGWNRQQWSKMWCDKFLMKLNIFDIFTYIGFIDTDTIFTSIITPQSIFTYPYNIDNPKPITIVNLGFGHVWWRYAGDNTQKWFGKIELFRHMSMFPVTFKVSHIQNFRNTTVQYWNMSDFDNVFQTLITQRTKYERGGVFSEFSIFATFVWYYERDMYEWYIEPNHKWYVRKQIYGIKGDMEEIFNFSGHGNVHDGRKESMVRIASHGGYIHNYSTAKYVMLKGYCFCIEWNSPRCETVLNTEIYIDLFIFEKKMKVWARDVYENQSLIAQTQYYQNVQQILSNH
eukprot:186085_1